MSITELGAGDFAGIGLLIPEAVFAVFMWLGWIQPSETGLALAFLGAIMLIIFRNIATSPTTCRMMGGSTVVTGLLLLIAEWKFRQTL